MIMISMYSVSSAVHSCRWLFRMMFEAGMGENCVYQAKIQAVSQKLQLAWHQKRVDVKPIEREIARWHNIVHFSIRMLNEQCTVNTEPIPLTQIKSSHATLWN